MWDSCFAAQSPGANTWADIERFCKAHQGWFEQFLELPFGIPSHDTFARVFRILDTQQLQHCLSAWVEHLQFCLAGQTVAIDGKTLRGSHDKGGSGKPLHVVNVWANGVNFSLGQISVTEKSNEIPAVQELLSILNLKGAVVTADAMPCQQKTATKIIDSDADYILQVKNNQPRLLKTIAKIFPDHEATDFAAKKVRSSTIRERNRTREETRIGMVCPAPVALRKQWTGLKTIGRMDRTRVLSNGTIQTETSYFIGNLPPLARRHVSHLREHWSIENTLHHTLDVTFAEDNSRFRKGNGPEIISVFRRLALSILKADTTVKDNVRGKRLIAG